MIRTFKKTVTAEGSAGAATGSADVGPVNGRVLAVHRDYSASAAATTDVTVATKSAPAQTILSVANTATDGWDYPRALMQGADGADLTGVYDALAVDDYLTLSVGGANDGDTVTFTILVEQDR